MDEESAVEVDEVHPHSKELDRPLPKHVYYTAMLISIPSYTLGFTNASIATAILPIAREFGLQRSDAAILAVIPYVSAVISAAFAFQIADTFGRKKALLLNNLIVIFSCLLSALSLNYTMLIISRFILGFAFGLASVITTLFITEVAPTDIRGRLGTFNQFALFFGTVNALFFGFITFTLFPSASVTEATSVVIFNNANWRILFGLGSVTAFLQLVFGWKYLQESPIWLIAHGFEREGFQELCNIYGTGNSRAICSKFDDHINKDHWAKKKVKLSKLFTIEKYQRTVIITIFLNLFQQLSGVFGPLTIFIVWLLKETLDRTVNLFVLFQNGSEIIQGIPDSTAMLIAAAIFIPPITVFILVVEFVDKSGRRRLLGISAMALSISLMILAWLNMKIWEWQTFAIISGFCLVHCAYALGVGSIPAVLSAEVLPPEIRGIGLSLGQSISWLTNFIVTLLFLSFYNFLGGVIVYWLMATSCMLCALFVYLFIIETKGISLEEMEQSYIQQFRKIDKKKFKRQQKEQNQDK